MEKIQTGNEKNSSAELPWLMMLTAADFHKKKIDSEILRELEEFSMNEQEIREAMIEWESLSTNKENRALYEARLKFLRDQLSNIRGERRAGREEGMKKGRKEGRKEGIREGRKEGIRQGMEKGQKEGMAKLVRNMARNGLEIEEIAKLTGLEETEISEMLRR